MTDQELEEGYRAAFERCQKLTLQLVRLSADRKSLDGIASGFFVQFDGIVFLLSAAHALEKGNWAIETTFVLENECQVACIPVNGAWIMKKLFLPSGETKELDVAWAKIDFASFERAVFKDPVLKSKRFEYLVYQGPFDVVPELNGAHGYVAANRVLLHDALGRKHLERQYSSEFEMRYKGMRSDGLYMFSIPKHEGGKYYEGASGSPIFAPGGMIVAIFVGGSEEKNELYGFPMNGVSDLMRVAMAVEKSQVI